MIVYFYNAAADDKVLSSSAAALTFCAQIALFKDPVRTAL